MNITTEKSDEALKGKVRDCNLALAEVRADLSRLRKVMAGSPNEAEGQAFAARVTELASRETFLDRKIDDMQREQRRRAGLKGIAIATCRAEWCGPGSM
jgi:predicted  nucleic acid-binding Zn-ribbon protein